MGSAPVILLLNRICPLNKHKNFWKIFILMLTFITYASYHLARRPVAVVKNVFVINACNYTISNALLQKTFLNKSDLTSGSHACGWKPFDSSSANDLLSIMDASFLFSYAFSIYVSGIIAERLDLRIFLSCGCILTGLFTILFGLAYYADIHMFTYFVTIQLLCGAAQATGWPAVVTIVGNWFTKHRRGLIFGLWNSHLHIGNVLGVLLAGYFVQSDWGLSFIVPGSVVILVGVLLFLTLPTTPKDLGFEEDHIDPGQNLNIVNLSSHSKGTTDSEGPPKFSSPQSESEQMSPKKKAIRFMEALRIPGVKDFALALFFAKFTSYIFMYWLPRYQEHVFKKGAKASAFQSAFFDVGGIVGSLAAGIIFDYTNCAAITCAGFLLFACPVLFCFKHYGGLSICYNILLQILCGALVDGPYGLITTAVSAELGKHQSLALNVAALATVTAIIDGTGSIGAAIGPLVAGPIATHSWECLFYVMMTADVMACLCLTPLAYKEKQRLLGPRDP